jgi:hypothetical protein
VSHLAWRSQPPDEPAADPAETPDEDAEIVDLTRQRLLGWLKGMFGGGSSSPSDRDRTD